MGFGKRPALVLIELQNYERGDKEEPIAESIRRFPSSCGDAAWKAVRNIGKILEVARPKKIPTVYTKIEVDPNGIDARAEHRKSELMPMSENWMYAGTWGARMIEEVAPQPGDTVLLKKRASAFFGTPLNAWFNLLGIDTVIVGGGTTSACVRATVYDSSALGYRTIVIEDCVFDRNQISHDVSLFDMDRQFADVVRSEEVIGYLQSRSFVYETDTRP
jgi:nicotinamidase-related amidase